MIKKAEINRVNGSYSVITVQTQVHTVPPYAGSKRCALAGWQTEVAI